MSVPRFTPRLVIAVLMVGVTACTDPVSTGAPGLDANAAVVPTCLGSSKKTEDLQACVTLAAVQSHLAALQTIADASGGNRAAVGPGYGASVQYVATRLAGAGYQVTLQPVSFTTFSQLSPSLLHQISPIPANYTENTDFETFQYTATGDVTGAVEAVDLTFGPNSTSGCEASDFAGFAAGSIALLERGMCEFHVKAENAAAAGAAAVIIFNRSDQTGLVGGTLLSGYSGGIPVVGATFDRGLEWAMTPGLVMRVSTTGEKRSFQVHSVIAENNLGDANNVVMLGGHLDSVVGGPGINDNGSGAAALLETALQMSGVKTRNRVRFAFWAAHEFGNLGSNTYLSNLTQAQLDAIVLYIDVVSIGSPNYVHFVLDGDGSDGEAGPAGSGSVEQYLKAFYTSRGLPTVPLRLPFFSNVLSFVDAGIASGAIYGGSVGIKTPEETLLFGGTAGDPYDPCYHLPCDTYANPSMAALDVNSDAVAYAVLGLGMNTEFVNGVKGQGRFKARKVVAQSSSTSLVTR